MVAAPRSLPRPRGRRGVLLLLPLAVAAVLATGWALAIRRQNVQRSSPLPPPRPAVNSLGRQAPEGRPGRPTRDLAQWSFSPSSYAFTTQRSGCTLHPDGRVDLPKGWAAADGRPHLFDTEGLPSQQEACGHCVLEDDNTRFTDPEAGLPARCCGVCSLSLCDVLYPEEDRPGAAARLLEAAGYRLRASSPCELFARIRGRTLWFVGDSQMQQLYTAAECFLHEFAPSLRRLTPLGANDSDALTTATGGRQEPAYCLQLALGTRVCYVWVDFARALLKRVLPELIRKSPNLSRDIMVLNAGVHYASPDAPGSKLQTDMAALAAWWTQNAAALPKLVWMDTSVQHPRNPPKGLPATCEPLRAWYQGDAAALEGGVYNRAVALLLGQLADARLRTWNATVPLWDTHQPGDCTHYCSPSAYHLWLHLLLNVLRDKQLGNQGVHAPEAAAAAAEEAGAVAAAEAAAAAAGWPG